MNHSDRNGCSQQLIRKVKALLSRSQSAAMTCNGGFIRTLCVCPHSSRLSWSSKRVWFLQRLMSKAKAAVAKEAFTLKQITFKVKEAKIDEQLKALWAGRGKVLQELWSLCCFGGRIGGHWWQFFQRKQITAGTVVTPSVFRLLTQETLRTSTDEGSLFVGRTDTNTEKINAYSSVTEGISLILIKAW